MEIVKNPNRSGYMIRDQDRRVMCYTDYKEQAEKILTALLHKCAPVFKSIVVEKSI